MRRLIPLAVIAAAVVAPIVGNLHDPAQILEQGFMILLPHQVLHGSVIYRDFHWYWGPGGLWVPAVVHGVAGWSEAVSRLIGVAYVAAAGVAGYGIGRRWSTVGGLIAGVIIVITMNQAIDLPFYGAVALVLLSIWCAVHNLERATSISRPMALLCGLLAGLAVLYRPDLVIAAVVVLLVLGWRARAQLAWSALGLAVCLGIFLGHGLWSGIGNMVNDVIVSPLHVRSERKLPLPPADWHLKLWLALIVLATLTLCAAGLRRMIISPEKSKGRVLSSVAALTLFLLPEIAQRADAIHLKMGGTVAIAFLPIAIIDLFARNEHEVEPGRGRHRRRRLRTGRAVSGGLIGAFLALWVIGSLNDAMRPYFHDVGVTLGTAKTDTITVRHADRSFTYDTFDAFAVEQVVAKVDAISKPGDRLFVGPSDMRRTPYNDDSIYVLLPQLTPATSFPDMHPRVALSQGTQLAADVQSADILVLTDQFAHWSEPNDSSLYGPDEANQVVRSEFCARATFSQYQVLTRC